MIKKQNIIKKAGDYIGIKNDALQWYNSDLERYADLINGCIFKGKKMVKSKRHKVKIDESTKYILPVFHIVLYHGWNQWKSKHSLQEMMYISEEVEEFIDQVTDYQSYVIDIHEQDPDLFTTEWADIFRLMRHSRKKEELKKYVDEHMDELKMLSKDTRMLLAVLLDQYEVMKDGKVEVKDMCEAWDGAMQMYAEEAAEKAAKAEREKAEKEIKEEREKAEKRLCSLCSILSKEKEYEKLNRVFEDVDFRQDLYVRYGIC